MVEVFTGLFLCLGNFVHNNIQFELSAYEIFLQSENFTLLEHTETKWETLENISRMDLADSDRGILEQLLEIEKSNS
jgi:8-oxo-dGTP diphosphatase